MVAPGQALSWNCATNSLRVRLWVFHGSGDWILLRMAMPQLGRARTTRSPRSSGLRFSPLGKALFRPASIFAMKALAKAGGFDPDEVSPEKAVAARAFPVLLICGTRDTTIPCRHAEKTYRAARGPKDLWVVNGAEHASALGHAPTEYENTVIGFLGTCSTEGHSEHRTYQRQ
jgi:pimeloyl-ACP methyl ester carboxylesterase